MATLTTMPVADGTIRTCVSCGTSFLDPRRSGSPRSYCDECVGRRKRRPGWREPDPVRTRVKGEPFTVEHFERWSRRLVLRGGRRFRLEEWERDFVRDLFQRRAGSPLHKECWLVVPEGNGKSTLVAVVVMYYLEYLHEARIPVAASARDQAEIIYKQADGFKRRTPGCGWFRLKPGFREIIWGENALPSVAKIYASDQETADGVIPVGLEVLDELHRHKDLGLYRTWAGKLDKEDAQLVVISTAGAPGSEFEEVREQMRQNARERTTNGCHGRYVGPGFVLHEWAVPEGGDVEDLALVKAANPSPRVTLAKLRAKRARPSWSLVHWRRLTCNMPTRDGVAAVSEREWDAAETVERIPDGTAIWLGLDLGLEVDTTALVPFWWRGKERRLLGDAVILEPPSDGSTFDTHRLEREVLVIHERTQITMVVMDPTRAEQLAVWLEEELGCDVVKRSQTNPQLAADYARFMEALRNGWLQHTGDPVLRRHVLNAVTQLLPDGQVKFVRPRGARNVPEHLRRRRVIDGLQAASMVNSVAAATLLEDEEEEEAEPLVAFA